MARFQSGAHLRESAAHATRAAFSDNEIAVAEARVRDQEAHVLRLIVQGAPTQSAEDQLRQLTAAAEAMRRRLSGR